MEMPSHVFKPQSATITRREDGAWDMVALCDAGNGAVGKVEFILDDATITVLTSHSPREDHVYGNAILTNPLRATSYSLLLATPLRDGVGKQEGIFLKMQFTEGGCDAAE